MLLPVLGRAKEKAKLAQCTNNQHQVTMALIQYLDDNDAVQPTHSWAYQWNSKPSVATWMSTWYFAVTAPYVGLSIRPETYSAIDGGNASMYFGYAKHLLPGDPVRNSVFFCPSEVFNFTSSQADVIRAEGANPHWYTVPTTYTAAGYTWHAAGQKTSFGWCAGADESKHSRALTSELRPADAPVYTHVDNGNNYQTCSNMYGFDEWGFTSYSYYHRTETDGVNTWGGNMHRQALPFAYLDGHMEIIDAVSMGNPAEHGPAGRQPLWSQRLWNRPQGTRTD
jgi:hypothetical protein